MGMFFLLKGIKNLSWFILLPMRTGSSVSPLLTTCAYTLTKNRLQPEKPLCLGVLGGVVNISQPIKDSLEDKIKYFLPPPSFLKISYSIY